MAMIGACGHVLEREGDLCSVCESKVVNIETPYWKIAGMDDPTEPYEEPPPMTVEELMLVYPQGTLITLTHAGERKECEVVGHKEVRLKDFRPAVRVYVKGYGTVLYSEEELEAAIAEIPHAHGL
jgi:hypothetical protein